MAIIYKPIKQYMQPNEITVNPKKNTKMSLIIGGQICTAYRLLIYDLQNNLIKDVSTDKLSTEVKYGINHIDLSGNFMTIASNNIKNGDSVRFVTSDILPRPLEPNRYYYIGNVRLGKFNIFDSKSNALNNVSPINILDTGEGSHSLAITEPLYDGDILEIFVEKNKLIAGNTYKWQVELFANELKINNVNVSTNTINITNHNFETGDMVYLFGDSLPEPLKAYTKYFVRKIDLNNIALFDNVEGARNDAGRIEITTTGDGNKIANVAISEQSVFSVYDDPVVTFQSETILEQSHTFKPKYVHPQGVMISSFTAYIKLNDISHGFEPLNGYLDIDINDVKTVKSSIGKNIISSGLQESSKLEYTFDGLLSGNVYDVKFIINTKVNQTYSTPWVSFKVNYSSSDIGIVPEATNNEKSSAIEIKWSGIKQNSGIVNGQTEFIENFVIENNYGLLLKANSTLKFNNLQISPTGSTPLFWWNPKSDNFYGKIFRCDNSKTGNFIEVGYTGSNFYLTIDDTTVNYPYTKIHSNFVYMIGIVKNQLVVNVIGNVNM